MSVPYEARQWLERVRTVLSIGPETSGRLTQGYDRYNDQLVRLPAPLLSAAFSDRETININKIFNTYFNSLENCQRKFSLYWGNY